MPTTSKYQVLLPSLVVQMEVPIGNAVADLPVVLFRQLLADQYAGAGLLHRLADTRA